MTHIVLPGHLCFQFCRPKELNYVKVNVVVGARKPHLWN